MTVSCHDSSSLLPGAFLSAMRHVHPLKVPTSHSWLSCVLSLLILTPLLVSSFFSLLLSFLDSFFLSCLFLSLLWHGLLLFDSLHSPSPNKPLALMPIHVACLFSGISQQGPIKGTHFVFPIYLLITHKFRDIGINETFIHDSQF